MGISFTYEKQTTAFESYKKFPEKRASETFILVQMFPACSITKNELSCDCFSENFVKNLKTAIFKDTSEKWLSKNLLPIALLGESQKS